MYHLELMQKSCVLFLGVTINETVSEREYLLKLKQHNIIEIKATVKVIETGQTCIKSDSFNLNQPSVQIKVTYCDKNMF
jgi:hypothetical protein